MRQVLRPGALGRPRGIRWKGGEGGGRGDQDGEQYGGSTKKLKIELPHDPEIPLLGIYPEKTSLKGYMQPNVHCGTVYNRKDTEAT